MASYDSQVLHERQLFQYVTDGRARKIQKLFEREKNIHVDSVNGKGQTLLYVSCLYKKLKVAMFLLRYGADPNKRCHDGSTPTHAAAYSGSAELLRSVVEEYGGDLRLHDNQMRTPNDWALRAGKSVNRKVLQMIRMWQNQVDSRVALKGCHERTQRPALIQDMFKSMKIEHLGYGSFLQLLSKRNQDLGYMGIPAVLPLASPLHLEASNHLSLTFKSPPSFVMEQALWCGHKVMVKRSRGKSLSLAQTGEDLLIHEAKSCRHLRHPHLLLLMSMCLVPCDESYTCTPRHWLVFEPINMGSLYYLLHTVHTPIKTADAGQFMIQIADALCYIHHRGLVHCAVSSHTIYLINTFVAKLGGLFCVKSNGDRSLVESSTSHVFSRWVAPEVILNGTISHSTDLYSYCVVVSEVLSGALPWTGCESTMIKEHIRHRRNYFVLPDWIPPSLQKTLLKGLKFYKHNRTVQIKDVAACLKLLLDDGELECASTHVFCSCKYSTSQKEGDSLSSPEKLSEKNVSDESYFITGIDVPDAIAAPSQIYPKKSELNDYPTHKTERQTFVYSRSKPDKVDAYSSEKLQIFESRPTEPPSRPHSSNFLREDRWASGILPINRHYSYPCVCCSSTREFTQSTEPCNNARSTKHFPSKDLFDAADNSRYIADNKMTSCVNKGGQIKAKEEISSLNGLSKRQRNTDHDKKNMSLPKGMASLNHEKFFAKSPPQKMYEPEFSIDRYNLLPQMPCCDENTAPYITQEGHLKPTNFFHRHEMPPDAGKFQVHGKPCIGRGSEDLVVSAVQFLPRHTLSYATEINKDVAGPRQALSTKSLLKCDSDNDFEERYNIEVEDLEEIFGDFALRRTTRCSDVKTTSNVFSLSSLFRSTPQTKIQMSRLQLMQSDPLARYCNFDDDIADDNLLNCSAVYNENMTIIPMLEDRSEGVNRFGKTADSESYHEISLLSLAKFVSSTTCVKPQVDIGASIIHDYAVTASGVLPQETDIDQSDTKTSALASDFNPKNITVDRHNFDAATCIVDNQASLRQDVSQILTENEKLVVSNSEFEIVDGSPFTELKDVEQKEELNLKKTGVDTSNFSTAPGTMNDRVSLTRSVSEIVVENKMNCMSDIQYETVEGCSNAERKSEGRPKDVNINSDKKEVDQSNFNEAFSVTNDLGLFRKDIGEIVIENEEEVESTSEYETVADSSYAELNSLGKVQAGFAKSCKLQSNIPQTPTKWPFQKKLYLFKILSDARVDKQLKRSKVSNAERVIKKFDRKPPTFLHNLDYPHSTATADYNVLYDSADQGKVDAGGSFKTSTPVCEMSRTGLVAKCRNAATLRSFAEIRSEMDEISKSNVPDEYSSRESQRISPHGDRLENPQKPNIPEEIRCVFREKDAGVENASGMLNQLEISQTKVNYMRKMVQGIIELMLEKVLYLTEGDFS